MNGLRSRRKPDLGGRVTGHQQPLFRSTVASLQLLIGIPTTYCCAAKSPALPVLSKLFVPLPSYSGDRSRVGVLGGQLYRLVEGGDGAEPELGYLSSGGRGVRGREEDECVGRVLLTQRVCLLGRPEDRRLVGGRQREAGKEDQRPVSRRRDGMRYGGAPPGLVQQALEPRETPGGRGARGTYTGGLSPSSKETSSDGSSRSR